MDNPTAHMDGHDADLAAAGKRILELEDALQDMLSGWRYIRETYGDLYGVGWDRAQSKAEAALRHNADVIGLLPAQTVELLPKPTKRGKRVLT